MINALTALNGGDVYFNDWRIKDYDVRSLFSATQANDSGSRCRHD